MFTFLFFSLILVGVPLYALPAMRSLPPGIRPGLKPLTIPEAASQLQATGKPGLELVEAARALVAERMAYCRRNSYDPAPTAFERGYGYCQQQAFALAALLKHLGFEAWVVHSLKNRFPNGIVTPHAWVRVKVKDCAVDVDSIHYDAANRTLAFIPGKRTYNYNLPFRLLAGWGSAAVNAHRYYLTGADMEPMQV